MSNRLTANVSIPSFARGKVRAFIKGHPAWAQWIAKKGVESREAKNADLIAFAMEHGLDTPVLNMIGGNAVGNGTAQGHPVANVPVVSGMGPFDSYDERDAMQALAKQERDLEVLAEVEAAREDVNFDLVFGPGASALAAKQSAEVAVTVEASSILANVDQFLSPFVRAEIEKALAPVIAAANKPAVTVEVEKIVTREAMPVAPMGAVAYAHRVGRHAVGKLFGFKSGNAKAEVTLWEAHGLAPAIDPMYVVDAAMMALMATALDGGTNVWLGGPGGSGKSSMPEQFAAYTGRPFFRYSFMKQTIADDLIGGTGVAKGDTQWVDGALVQAMRRPGTVILLDEITLAPPGTQALIQGIADSHRSLLLPTGERVICAPGVVFCVADNTMGYGDETGQYHGTHAANQALVDRFAVMLRIDYMPKEQEAKALANHCPGAPLVACEHVVEFINRARRMPEMEGLVLSLRGMIALVRTVQRGFDAKTAAAVALFNRLPATERAALESLFTLTWAGEFEALMKGATPAAPASDSEAAQAFDDEESASLVG